MHYCHGEYMLPTIYSVEVTEPIPHVYSDCVVCMRPRRRACSTSDYLSVPGRQPANCAPAPSHLAVVGQGLPLAMSLLWVLGGWEFLSRNPGGLRAAPFEKASCCAPRASRFV